MERYGDATGPDGELQHRAVISVIDEEVHDGLDDGGKDDLGPPLFVVLGDPSVEEILGHHRLLRSAGRE